MVDVDAIDARHQPFRAPWGGEYCKKCANRWPCDAHLLIEMLRSAPPTKPRLPLDEVVGILAESATAKGAYEWLQTPNRLLGAETPLELLNRGEVERVKNAARSFVEGGYV